MSYLSGLGLGLTLVFGCLLLALAAELYYLIWWKKRISSTEIEDDYSSPASEFLHMFCWKRPLSLSSNALNPHELCSSVRITDTLVHEPQPELHLHSKELWLKAFEEDDMETELMRLHSLSGPSRFLFTIREETKEDLESEDGKSTGDGGGKGSRSRSLSDLVLTVETPFLTPLASPPYFTPPLTPLTSCSHHGFNPLFESSMDAEFNGIKSSPPPKFKFLIDAEDKLHRRETMQEAAENGVHKTDGSVQDAGVKAFSTPMLHKDEESGSFITLNIAKNKEREPNHHHSTPQYHSSSSQVHPLASFPPTFRTTNKKPILHKNSIN